MSDYKILNGKKARECKYGCKTMLVWSDEISKFIEESGGVTHTPERCKFMKQKQGKQPEAKQEFTLEAVLKKLESIGIKINLMELMKE